jgi:hypothetical protein
VTAASGRPPGDALGGRHQIGHHLLVLDGEHHPGTGEPALDLVGDEQHVLGGAPPADPGQESRRGNDEAALALDRLDHHGRHPVRTDLLLDDADRPVGGLFTGDRGRLVERVGHRGAVDLPGERAETVLVGHVLRGHRHGQVRPPVVGVVEHDDGPTVGQPDRIGDGPRLWKGKGRIDVRATRSGDAVSA